MPFVARYCPQWLLILAVVFLWMSYVLSRWLDRRGFGALARTLEVIGANWVGVAFLLFVCFLATDLVTGFGYFLPRLAPVIRGWGVVAALVLCLIGMVQARRDPVVRHYEVRLANLPPERDGTVLVLATDLHLDGELGERWLATRVEQIQAERPDIIIFGGDILEGHRRFDQDFLQHLQRLSAPLGKWAVTGNHEYYGGFAESVRLLEKAGFRVLRDEWAQLQPGLVIAGVNDLTARRRFGMDGNFVQQALAGRPAGSATIFISHTPWEADRAAQAGSGLMLSGHTHNGQIWPFNYVVKRVHPLLGGRYEIGGMTVIVCRGTGTWGPRIRLWNRSELVRITLRSPAKN